MNALHSKAWPSLGAWQNGAAWVLLRWINCQQCPYQLVAIIPSSMISVHKHITKHVHCSEKAPDFRHPGKHKTRYTAASRTLRNFKANVTQQRPQQIYVARPPRPAAGPAQQSFHLFLLHTAKGTPSRPAYATKNITSCPHVLPIKSGPQSNPAGPTVDLIASTNLIPLLPCQLNPKARHPVYQAYHQGTTQEHSLNTFLIICQCKMPLHWRSHLHHHPRLPAPSLVSSTIPRLPAPSRPCCKACLLHQCQAPTDHYWWQS